MFSLLGIPMFKIGWIRGPALIFIVGWLLCILGGVALLFFSLPHLFHRFGIIKMDTENVPAFCGSCDVSAPRYGEAKDVRIVPIVVP
jgi:hypothetical protein